MMRQQLIAIALFLPLCAAAQQKETVKLSLQQAKDHALQHSFEAKGAALDIQQADKDIWMATARLLPQINGEVSFNHYTQIPTTVAPANAFGFPDYLTEFLGGVSQQTGVPINAPPIDENATTEFQFGQPFNMNVGGSASMPLFNGTYIIGLKGAKGLKQLQATKSKVIGYEIVAKAEENYFTALVAAENARILKDNLVNLKKTFTETSALFESGFAEQMDVDQMELLVTTMENQISMAERQAEAAKNLLKYTIGMPVETPVELSDGLELLWQSADPEQLLSKEFKASSNINFNLVNQDVVMHKYLTQIEQSKYLPTLSAFFNYQQQAFGDKFNFFGSDGRWFPLSLWGVTLNVPIWDNLGNLASIKKAKLEEQRKRDQRSDVEEGLKLRHLTAKDNFSSSLEQLVNAEKGLRLARSVRSTVLVKYTEGLSTSMDLTQAENQLTQAQADYINRLFSALDAKLELSRVFEE
jgi:outer membrane protein TolC